MTTVKKKINTKGMTCNSCEKIIAKQVFKLPGVEKIHISYSREKAEVEFDDTKVTLTEIKKAIEEKGYLCEDDNNNGNNNNNQTKKKQIFLDGFLRVLVFSW